MNNQELTHICRRCGRKLRNEEAQKRGMGYVCYQKSIAEDKNKKKLFKISSLHSSNNGV